MKADPTCVKIIQSIFVNKNLLVFMRTRQITYSSEMKIVLYSLKKAFAVCRRIWTQGLVSSAKLKIIQKAAQLH